jgi:formylglycine-generating enzyme required for sulfatase activity
MGNFDLDAMSSERRQQVVKQIATLYREAPEPGVHAAAAFVLRNWQQQEVLADIDIDLANEPPSAGRHWFINSQGQSFAVLEGPVALPPPRQASVIEPAAGEVFHQFAIGMHEVTLAEFQRSRPEHEYDAQYTPDPSCPAPNVSWYDAVAYCNWLNELEDIPSEQWCYKPNDDGKYAAGMRIAEDYLTRAGYRLPTDTESQFACRAYASTEFGFGEPVELLDRYSWYLSNADSHSWPVGSKLPNAMGMFDMHGNAWEWCHSQAFPPEGEAAENYQDVIVSGEDFRVMRGGGFLDIPEYVRWTYRSDDLPGNPEGDVGFRIARTIK